MKSFLLFIFIAGIVAAPVFAKQPEWLRKIKRIEVLKSTKVEVEKLFGNPQVIETNDFAVKFKNGWGRELKYETKYGTLEIDYAAGKCSEVNAPYSWDVAADIVLRVKFSPNEIVFENQLGYDLGKFKNDSDSETNKKYSFETEKLKITVEVKNFQVSSIEFEVPEKRKTQLECKNFKIKEPVWLEKMRTLEIFKSTRSEVEALFGNPRISEINDTVKDGDDFIIQVEYLTADGVLQVEYSTGKCFERKSKYGYDAEKDTLVELKFLPTEKLDATETNYDLRKLRNGLGDELGVYVYIYDKMIEYIKFYPSEKQEEEFDCEKVLDLQK